MNSATEIGDSSRYTPTGFLHTRLVANDLAGADAADGDLALAGAEIGDVQAGDVARELREIGGAGGLDVLGGHRGNREGHILQRWWRASAP